MNHNDFLKNDLNLAPKIWAAPEIIKAIKNGTLSEEELYNACYNVVKQVMGSALQKQYVKEKKNG